MTPKVAVVLFAENTEADSLRTALGRAAGVDDLNTARRTAAAKGGVLRACWTE